MRYLLASGWVLAAILGLVLYFKPAPEPQIQYQDRVVQEKVDTVVETRTTTTKPDGTVIVREQNKVTTNAINVITKSQPVVKAQYSLGVSVKIPLDEFRPKAYQLTGGVRLGDSPVWLTTGIEVPSTWELKKTTYLLGLSIEF